MEGHQGMILELIFASFTIRNLVQAQQDQQGFISLDCGLPTKESPYIEKNTKLKFSTDADFIQSGESGKVADDWLSEDKQYNVLRYFPETDGKRNCYNLMVEQGRDYLIRAGFLYGNYDGRNRDPRVDLYIGPNLWTTVETQYLFNYEIIHKPKSNSLQICLIKTGETIPMISTLELRPLRDGVYITQSGSLRLGERAFYKNEETHLRYVNSNSISMIYNKESNNSIFLNFFSLSTTPELLESLDRLKQLGS